MAKSEVIAVYKRNWNILSSNSNSINVSPIDSPALFDRNDADCIIKSEKQKTLLYLSQVHGDKFICKRILFSLFPRRLNEI